MAEYKHVSGLAQLERALKALPPAMRKRLLIEATMAAATPIEHGAIELAPLWHGDVSKGHPPPGTLKRSIKKMYLPKASSSTRTQAIVRVMSGERARTIAKTKARVWDPTTGRRGLIRYTIRETAPRTVGAFYWWWVEYGSAHNAPRLFMTKAFIRNNERGINAFREVVQSRLPSLVAKVKAESK